MSHQLRTLIELAAEMRSGGSTWESIAQKVRRSVHTCQRWPKTHAGLWNRFYHEAAVRRHTEAGAEGLFVLRQMLRSPEERSKLKAAELLIKLPPRSGDKNSQEKPELSPLELDVVRALEDARSRTNCDFYIDAKMMAEAITIANCEEYKYIKESARVQIERVEQNLPPLSPQEVMTEVYKRRDATDEYNEKEQRIHDELVKYRIANGQPAHGLNLPGQEATTLPPNWPNVLPTLLLASCWVGPS